MIVPVILSGGSGSRLWPLSRAAYPKQLLPIAGERTMLQETLLRLDGVAEVAPPLLVVNDQHRFIVAEQARGVGMAAAGILLEPEGRNTAPAVAVAALEAVAAGADPLLLVLPADHVVPNVAAFHAALAVAVPLAEGGGLVTFGIVPHYPETGYGYIRAGAAVGEGGRRVERFVEKPALATAQGYLAEGGYYWNSGMFLFRASAYLAELERHAAAMAAACRAAHAGSVRDLDFIRLDAAAFHTCPADSIDYAVMERTEQALMVPLDAGWSDVGSWQALWEIGVHDEAGNVASGDVILHDVHDSYIRAENRMVAAIGVRDHVIVETDDAVLVAHRSQVQEVKRIVERLKESDRPEAVLHRKVDRPWGCFETLDSEGRFKVKRIKVRPGASLSLQMHHHRAEHWVVVKGTARITRGDEELLLTENQSTYIPLGVKHRLENPGLIPLEIIEVQSGSYLGEDDILRFEDHYGR